MADSSGVISKAAVKRPADDSAWSGVSSTITNQIPIISESMTTTLINDYEEAVEGETGRPESEIVGTDVAGTVTTDLWFDGLEYMFHAAFGFECPTVWAGAHGSGSGGSPSFDTASSPDAFQHLFEPDSTIERAAWVTGERAASSGVSGDDTYWTSSAQKVRCFDLGIDKTIPTSSAWAFWNCMVKSMTIKASLDGVTVEWALVGYSTSVAPINQDNWTFTGTRVRAVFPNLRVYLGPTGSSKPSEINVTEAMIKLENPMSIIRESGTSSEYISEPTREAPRKVSGSLKIGRYNVDTLPGYLRAGTELQLSLDFVSGSVISGSTWYPTAQFICPLVKLTKAEFPVAGPGVITGDIEFESFVAATPTWVTTLAGGASIVKAQEIYFFLRNTLEYCWSRDNQSTSAGALP